MKQEPKVGTQATCVMCLGPIAYVGPYWQHTGALTPRHPALPICETCTWVHGRDTNSPIQCPHCNRIIGCFWHDRNIKHIRQCRR